MSGLLRRYPMRSIATLATLLVMTALAFGLDPYRNRMNDEYPVVEPQEALGWAPLVGPQETLRLAPADVPPATENRMNYQYPQGPAPELAAVPNPSENRLNYAAPQAESSAQAEKPAKHRR
jgi:hypothetical protein